MHVKRVITCNLIKFRIFCGVDMPNEHGGRALAEGK